MHTHTQVEKASPENDDPDRFSILTRPQAHGAVLVIGTDYQRKQTELHGYLTQAVENLL